jgi:hypothetical protein
MFWPPRYLQYPKSSNIPATNPPKPKTPSVLTSKPVLAALARITFLIAGILTIALGSHYLDGLPHNLSIAGGSCLIALYIINSHGGQYLENACPHLTCYANLHPKQTPIIAPMPLNKYAPETPRKEFTENEIKQGSLSAEFAHALDSKMKGGALAGQNYPSQSCLMHFRDKTKPDEPPFHLVLVPMTKEEFTPSHEDEEDITEVTWKPCPVDHNDHTRTLTALLEAKSTHNKNFVEILDGKHAVFKLIEVTYN